MITIRKTTEESLDLILSAHQMAFGGNDEAELVKDLLNDISAHPLTSLMAFVDNEAAGHVLFTNVSFEPSSNLSARILAPLAVVPKFQKQGVGRKLIERGLQMLKEDGSDLVFVLGYPEYYSRFGFTPAGKRGFEATYPIDLKNADAWMVLALHV